MGTPNPKEVVPAGYYHAFLGNGIDAVLIGYTGSMVPDRINGPDRCYWYKADRYYPPEVPVLPALDRRLLLGPDFRPQPDEPWYELAPLGRCWYDVAAPVQWSRQVFDPARAVLQSEVEYPSGRVRIMSFLHASYPVLVERYELPARMSLRLVCAAGPWVPAPDDLAPFSALRAAAGPVPNCYFTVGASEVGLTMMTHPEPQRWGTEGEALWVEVEGNVITRYFAIVDAREERIPGGSAQGALTRVVERVRAEGFDRLYGRHVQAWKAYHDRGGQMIVASEELARVCALTGYQTKAIQDPATGAIPVNNLRATWSSHVFWDAGFPHLLMLQSGHTAEAELACGFLERLRPQAAEAARAYGARGLKYEWEMTHHGRAAFGVHRHLTHQLHNNAMYSIMCWHQYAYTRSREVLARFYPVMRGIAEFFLTGLIRPGEGIRPVTGITEMPAPVALDATTLAGAIRALRIAALAARTLEHDVGFIQQCETAADGLYALFTRLIDGGILYASDRRDITWGVLPACSWTEVLSPDDPIVLRTARALASSARNPHHGIVGHGVESRGGREGFPWVAGWLASIFAAAGAADEAAAVLRPLPRAVCIHGGMPEKVHDDGSWNMQYFTTAQAAGCLGLYACLSHAVRGILHIEAPPWEGGTFQGIHLHGLALSGAWEGDHITACALRNVTANSISQPVRVNGMEREVHLRPQEETRIV